MRDLLCQDLIIRLMGGCGGSSEVVPNWDETRQESNSTMELLDNVDKSLNISESEDGMKNSTRI